MKKHSNLILIALIAAFAILDITPALADESIIKVKTLTFDSILTRRGTWKFPDDNQEYRKILMKYTLKCDPRTAADKYNCGEWDYSTYTYIHHKVGRDTMLPMTHSKYKIGKAADLEMKYSPVSLTAELKPQTKRTAFKLSGTIKKEANVESTKMIDGDKQLILGQKPIKVQYYFSNAKMKELGQNGKAIGKIKLNFTKAGSTLKNLQIRAVNKILQDTALFNDETTLLYKNDFTATNAGWNEIILSEPFYTKTNGLGLILIISADGFSNNDEGLLAGEDQHIVCDGAALKYLEFDGTNDYVYAQDIGIMNDQSKFTIEGCVKINKWSNWSKVFGVGSETHFETGGKGELYFFMRNGANSYGVVANALQEGKWAHVAAVFNGAGTKNEDKLKIYINGKLATASYSSVIPERSSKNKNRFTITSTDWGSACINGGVSNVRVWDKPLSQEEIQKNMNKVLDASDNSLILNYSLQNIQDDNVTDESKSKNNGKLLGFPNIKTMKGEELFLQSDSKLCPSLECVFGDFEIEAKKEKEIITEPMKVYSLAEYEIENHQPKIKNLSKVWKEGYVYTYDENNKAIDSVFFKGDLTVKNDTLKYLAAPIPIVQNIEIGRFITPYGINLDLGPDGFTWVYDVTDYAPILRGDVELSAGNLQELIDLTFEFYKGVPPRKIVNFTELWEGYHSHSYQNLADNKVLRTIDVPKTPSAASAKVKTRITGHGHESTDNQYPHCCEWKDNTHYLDLNGETKEWHIWREDCSINPVYPQGGTWPGSREGWCPGDKVREIEFEVSKYDEVKNNKFDYEISDIPSNNKGMGRGNYEMTFQFVEYGPQTHNNDVEVYDVFAPNENGLYSRMNPICANPRVVIRNNGSSNLTSLKFKSTVSGGKAMEYTWTGNLKPNIMDTVSLPIASSDFWIGDGKNNFTVSVSEPNGKADEYAANDEMTTHFIMPDIVEAGATLELITPSKYTQYMSLTVKDITGKVVVDRTQLEANKTYKELLNLPEGCYTMEMINTARIGISYWAAKEMGKGSLKLFDANKKLIKTFNPDFGYSIVYSFNIGKGSYVQDPENENLISVYPNPATNEVICSIDEAIGASEIELFDNSGKTIQVFPSVNPNSKHSINIENLPAGNYFLRFKNNNYNVTKNFIKK